MNNPALTAAQRLSDEEWSDALHRLFSEAQVMDRQQRAWLDGKDRHKNTKKKETA